MQSHDQGPIPVSPDTMLSEMARIYKYDLSEFEAMLWEVQIFSVYPAQDVMRALLAHMESGTQDANFMPKYGAIKAKLEPVGGFKQIEAAVRLVGPYSIPEINDPVLLTAIDQMGGWTRVCSELPDPVERPIDFDRYVKRFETALLAAKNQVQVRSIQPPALKSLAASEASNALQITHAPTRALPAPSDSQSTQASIDLSRSEPRASIWKTPKP